MMGPTSRGTSIAQITVQMELASGVASMPVENRAPYSLNRKITMARILPTHTMAVDAHSGRSLKRVFAFRIALTI